MHCIAGYIVDKDVRHHIFHGRPRKTVVKPWMKPWFGKQQSILYCTLFRGIFTRSGSKLWAMEKILFSQKNHENFRHYADVAHSFKSY